MAVASRLRSERERAASLVQDLRSELAGILEATDAGPDDEHDAEGSTVAYERARVQALLAHAQRSLAALDDAAGRGSFDHRCEGCGAPIGAERLAALPATRACVGCAAATQVQEH